MTTTEAIKKMYELHSGVYFLIPSILIEDIIGDTMDELISEGLAEQHTVEIDKYRLTRKGKAIANDIACDNYAISAETATLDRDALKAEAEALGIKVHHSAKAETIKAKIEEHKE